jgi:hypothetical protein
MTYPTLEKVQNASHVEVCTWWRFLPGPGMSAIGKDNFKTVLEAEAKIMDAIQIKLREYGGFTPEISKEIGWGD